MAPRTSFIVTGVCGRGVGLQIAKSLQLSRLDKWIIGTDLVSQGADSAPIDEFAILPPADSPEYIPSLLQLIKRTGASFLIPCTEQELRTLTAIRHAEFAVLNCQLIWQNPTLFRRLDDKYLAANELRSLGIPSPKTVLIDDMIQLTSLKFPMLLKPRLGRGSEGIEFVRNLEELGAVVTLIKSRKLQADYICQEYVDLADGEFTAGILHLPNGNYFGSTILRREISSSLSRKLFVPDVERSSNIIVSSGTSQGVFIDNLILETELARISTLLGSRGPLNIQFRMRDNKISVFEINPRLSGSSFLRALAGHNEIEVLTRFYLNLPLPEWKGVGGKIAVREISETVS